MANTWISETENDIEELQITQDITERTPLRNKLHNFKGFQEKLRRKTGAAWTEERREKHKERMRNTEEENKETGRKKDRIKKKITEFFRQNYSCTLLTVRKEVII